MKSGHDPVVPQEYVGLVNVSPVRSVDTDKVSPVFAVVDGDTDTGVDWPIFA